MADDKLGFVNPAGARTTRQETITTEVHMPALQAMLRAGIDILALLLIVAVSLILGRWAIWLTIAIFFWSERYQKWADMQLSKLFGAAATIVEVMLVLLQWSWLLTGWLWLRVVVPVTWTLEGELWIQTAQLAPAWPFFFWRAAWVEMAFGPFWRLIALLVCAAPLASWGPLRDRMKWSLWEFTPYAPVNASDQGIDPHRWVKKEVASVAPRGAGIVVERVDYRPHEHLIANGVAISNASGRSSYRIDMGWVTPAQWKRTAEILLLEKKGFTEESLGRGAVFPTHGPVDAVTGARLGFRYFRSQCEEAGLIEMRGAHENAGYDLTEAGRGFFQRRLDEKPMDFEFEQGQGDEDDDAE